jgi:hypothetical protein
MRRVPLDFDFVATQEEADAWIASNYEKVGGKRVYTEKDGRKVIVEGDTMVEFDIVSAGSSDEMLVDLVKADKDTLETSFGMIPKLNTLFAIKDSHKYKKFGSSLNNHFWKTAIDWHTMKRMGCVIEDGYKDFHKLREKESYATQAHPKLNVNKDEFFNEAHGVVYEFQHDSLHEAVKHLDKPAYIYYAKDDQPVFSDKVKFFACDPMIRFYGAIEEASVLALERSILVHGTWAPKVAWTFGLSKIASSITSGFFRKWVYENIFDILKMYPEDYVEKFNIGLKNGTVRRISTPSY